MQEPRPVEELQGAWGYEVDSVDFVRKLRGGKIHMHNEGCGVLGIPFCMFLPQGRFACQYCERGFFYTEEHSYPAFRNEKINRMFEED